MKLYSERLPVAGDSAPPRDPRTQLGSPAPGAFQFSLDEPPPEEVGMLMTSMIDVIFILLAFFVCVSEVRQGKLQIDVPEVAETEARSRSDREPLRIEITARDEVFLGGDRVDGAALERLLAQEARRHGPAVSEVPVVIAGDKQARNGTTMKVMGQLAKAGFKRFEFAVEGGG